jgi:hypothetical protein
MEIPDKIPGRIATKISISYTEGGNDKVKEFKKLLKIE